MDPIEHDAFDKLMHAVSTTEINKTKDASVQLNYLTKKQVNELGRSMIFKLMNV